jgi:hypothetical protein
MFRSWILILFGTQELTKNGCPAFVSGFVAHHARSYRRKGRPETRRHGENMLAYLSYNDFSLFEMEPLSGTSFQNTISTKLSASSSIPISDSGIGEVPAHVLIPGVFLLGAISAFVFANVVYTPEILENAGQIRSETRDKEIRSVLDVVRLHIQEGKDLEELRRPLEVALDMTIEDYVQAVTAEKNSSNEKNDDDRSTEFTEADIGLASILDAKMTILANDDPKD